MWNSILSYLMGKEYNLSSLMVIESVEVESQQSKKIEQRIENLMLMSLGQSHYAYSCLSFCACTLRTLRCIILFHKALIPFRLKVAEDSRSFDLGIKMGKLDLFLSVIYLPLLCCHQ